MHADCFPHCWLLQAFYRLWSLLVQSILSCSGLNAVVERAQVMTPLLRHLPGQMPHFQSFVIQPNFKCLSSALALNGFLRLRRTKTIFCCCCFENKVKGEQTVLLTAIFWQNSEQPHWLSEEPDIQMNLAQGLEKLSCWSQEKSDPIWPSYKFTFYRQISKTLRRVTHTTMGERTRVCNVQTPGWATEARCLSGIFWQISVSG